MTEELELLQNHYRKLELILSIQAKDVLTKEEAAELLGISPETLKRRISDHEIPFYKNGAQAYFKKSELYQIMTQARIASNADATRRAELIRTSANRNASNSKSITYKR